MASFSVFWQASGQAECPIDLPMLAWTRIDPKGTSLFPSTRPESFGGQEAMATGLLMGGEQLMLCLLSAVF